MTMATCPRQIAVILAGYCYAPWNVAFPAFKDTGKRACLLFPPTENVWSQRVRSRVATCRRHCCRRFYVRLMPKIISSSPMRLMNSAYMYPIIQTTSESVATRRRWRGRCVVRKCSRSCLAQLYNVRAISNQRRHPSGFWPVTGSLSHTV